MCLPLKDFWRIKPIYLGDWNSYLKQHPQDDLLIPKFMGFIEISDSFKNSSNLSHNFKIFYSTFSLPYLLNGFL